MKTINDIDDPRLTAWALGELEGADAEAVAAFVQDSEEARAAVEQIRELAGQLGDQLATEASGEALILDEGRRDTLSRALNEGAPPARRPTLVTRMRPFMAVAAVLLVTLFVADTLFDEYMPYRTGIQALESVPSSEILASSVRENRMAGDAEVAKAGRGSASGAADTAIAQYEDAVVRQLPQLGHVPEDSPAAESLVASVQRALVAVQATQKPPVEELSLDFDGGAATGGAGRFGGRAVPGTARPKTEFGTVLIAEQRDSLRALGYVGDGGDRDGHRARHGREMIRSLEQRHEGERYASILENSFVPITSDPLSALSTFGVDVDTAAYANMRRYLHRNQLPPSDAVRIEELVNYFSYDERTPDRGDAPFATLVEVSGCPWQPRHRLVRVSLTGERISSEERSASHLVFLLDVSGSMKDADKLPLLINSFELLLDDVRPGDKVSIVTYASGTQVVLPPTSCEERQTILNALHGLRADGSTHASAGIQLAYDVATQGFIEGGNNRIILATDGDFNVGVTSDGGLYDLIRAKAASGVFLTVLGFGTGNLKDATAELLADNGNGNYAYIDSLNEAHKVLVAERDATLVTIAKDVKLQVEFNPGKVAAYRLLGYENRSLAATDFRDDKKDAGEIGAGHSVVAFYEIVPRGVEGVTGTVELKYQQLPEPKMFVDSPELLTVNLRWKRPDEDVARELAVPVLDTGKSFAESREEFRFSAAVAAFGMLLRGSQYAGQADLKWVVETAESARSFDPNGDRSEFVRLVRTAQGLMGR